jgi:hypothetical protein
MPATFVADFAATTAEVQEQVAVFIHGRQTDQKNTAAKIAANNEVAMQLSILLADAKVVFRNDAVRRQFFTLSYLRRALQPSQDSE